MSTAHNPTPASSGSPYAEATARAATTFKRWAQLVVIDRVDCAWGNILLRRIVEHSKSAFELVVDSKQEAEAFVFKVDAKVVGEAIVRGETGLVASLESSPQALAAVGQWVEGVKEALEAVEVAKASATAPSSGRKAPRV